VFVCVRVCECGFSVIGFFSILTESVVMIESVMNTDLIRVPRYVTNESESKNDSMPIGISLN
jgi:hypothetical protein